MEIGIGQRFRVTHRPYGVRIDVLPTRDQHAWVALGMGAVCLAFGFLLLIRGDGRPALLQEPWRIQGMGPSTLLVGAGLIVAGGVRARRTVAFEASSDRLSAPGRRSWARADVADIEVDATGTRAEDFSKRPVAGLYVRSTDGSRRLLVEGKDTEALEWLAHVLRLALQPGPPEGACTVCGREAAWNDRPAWPPPGP